ncbi:hypothetical protein GJV26_04880 [Massilia dura]|uniref:Beta/gamma crystallin 'Greek key' domain-containing protein n=3 Tax=Pseudoduganella dura TaxID=321982 RepID=A0A6I3XE16_9BURK|nr:hypothetical protein [Pseudoduganella dura]
MEQYTARISRAANASDGENMKRLFAAAALLATLTHIGHAAAGEMTLYSRPDFRGSQVTVRGPASNFEKLGFNDRASSIIVHSGAWEVCEHKDFGGYCAVMEKGEHATLNRFSDAISSVREVDRWRGRDDNRGDNRGEYRDHDDRGERRDRRGDEGRGAPVELFGTRNFDGDRMAIWDDVRTLRSKNFNDRAGSLVVREGEWQLCEHDDYRGRCAVFGPGRYPMLQGLNNMASSLRRVR